MDPGGALGAEIIGEQAVFNDRFAVDCSQAASGMRVRIIRDHAAGYQRAAFGDVNPTAIRRWIAGRGRITGYLATDHGSATTSKVGDPAALLSRRI